MPSASIDPVLAAAPPESRRAGLLDRVWAAATRWREKPEAARQEGPLVDLRDLLWAKVQAGDLTLGGKPSPAMERWSRHLEAGDLRPREGFESRFFFDALADGYGVPRGAKVRDEPIQARRAQSRARESERDIARPQRERDEREPMPRETPPAPPSPPRQPPVLDRIRAVWGLDAAGNPTRPAPTIRLPPREQRTKMPAPARQAAPRPERVYLSVPFAEKDRVKAAGARWDKGAKAWYVPEGRDAAAFRVWLPEQARTTARTADPVAEFAEALRRAGLDVPRPEMDGKLHRVRVDGDKGREKSGAYVGHLDGHPAGFIQNFKTGEKVNWRQERPDKAVDRAEMARLVAEREARKIAEQERLAEQHRGAARTAQAVWDRAMQAPNDHPYVARKGVDGRDARVGTPGQSITVSDGKGDTRDMSVAGWLIVPVFTKDRGPSSLQFISPEPNGGKVFLPGGKMQGGHCVIGRMGHGPGSAVLICEGWATGKTLHALTGLPVVVSFNAGNLREVAEMVAAKHPERTVLVAGDNDHKKEREMDLRTGKPRENIGRVRAEEAARAVGGVAVLPPFKAHEKGSDWNDLASLRGPATARSVLRGMVAEAERTVARTAERGAENVVPFGRGRSEPARSQVRDRDHGVAVEMER